MALPTIPTSFVPHAALTNRRSAYMDFGGALSFFAYALLIIVFALAIGVFFYGRILSARLIAKDAAVKEASESIDQTTVQGFVQLRDRLNSGRLLLANHVAMSNFFSSLESILPSTVRFVSLHIMIDTTGVAKVEGTGVSKSFNALSVASGAFASDGRIKDVIFSKMNINKDNSVSFGFSAVLDPKLVAYSPGTEASVSEPSPVTTP